MLKILFINAVDYNYEIETRYPSLGLGYLVAILHHRFKDKVLVRIIDHKIEEELSLFRPDVVGISVVSQNYQIAKQYAQMAKEWGAVVIIGGCHISVLPGTLTPSTDIGVLFEGEETIGELINLLIKEKGKLRKTELSKIKGIVYWDKGKLVKTGLRPLIKNLDTLPFPERSLLQIGKHTYMFTTRGCPYRCVFCASSRFWQAVRFFSAEYVVEETKHILGHYPRVTLISFYDDLFTLDEKRLARIVDLMRKNKIDQKVKFSCSCRANLLNERIVKLLKKMNIVSVGLGLESGNSRILNYLKGSSVNLEDNYQAVRLLKKYKIAVNASFIIGSPDETEKEIMETYNFIKKSKSDFFDIYVLTPLPGTPIWEEAKAEGLVEEHPDWNWAKLNINFERNKKDAVILARKVTRERLIKIYQKFRTLQTFLRVKNIWFHPFLWDRPRYLVSVFWRSLKRKIFSGRIVL